MCQTAWGVASLVGGGHAREIMHRVRQDSGGVAIGPRCRMSVHWKAARYFGTELDGKSLTPGDAPRLGAITVDEWLVNDQ